MTVRDFPTYNEFQNVWKKYNSQISIHPESYIGSFMRGILRDEEWYKDHWLKIFRHFSGMDVLDIGCGSGVLSLITSYVANSVHGIDITKHWRPSWLLIRCLGDKDRISFRVQDAKKLESNYLLRKQFNAALVSGLAPDFGESGINRIYEVLDYANIRVIVASKYSFKDEDDEVYRENLKRHPCLSNYDILDNNKKFMVLRRNCA